MNELSRATRPLVSADLTDLSLEEVWASLSLSRRRLGVVLLHRGQTVGSVVIKGGHLLEAVNLRSGVTGVVALETLAQLRAERVMVVEVLQPVANERPIGLLHELWQGIVDEAPTVVMPSASGPEPPPEAVRPEPEPSPPPLEPELSSLAHSSSHASNGLRLELLVNDLALQRQRTDRMVGEMRALQAQVADQQAVLIVLRSRQVLTQVAVVAMLVVVGGFIAGLVGLAALGL